MLYQRWVKESPSHALSSGWACSRPERADSESLVILLRPPLPFAGVSIGTNRGCQPNDRTLADVAIAAVEVPVEDLVELLEQPRADHVVDDDPAVRQPVLPLRGVHRTLGTAGRTDGRSPSSVTVRLDRAAAGARRAVAVVDDVL